MFIRKMNFCISKNKNQEVQIKITEQLDVYKKVSISVYNIKSRSSS